VAYTCYPWETSKPLIGSSVPKLELLLIEDKSCMEKDCKSKECKSKEGGVEAKIIGATM
jgi:hypothetical protein